MRDMQLSPIVNQITFLHNRVTGLQCADQSAMSRHVSKIIGVLIAGVVDAQLANGKRLAAVIAFSQSHPALFYPLFFLLTFQIADMFENARSLVGAMYSAYQIVFH
jgi:hypothetical protein